MSEEGSVVLSFTPPFAMATSLAPVKPEADQDLCLLMAVNPDPAKNPAEECFHALTFLLGYRRTLPAPATPEETEMNRSSTKTQQKIVDDWNREHPVGTPVIRYRLVNPLREPCEPTVTRSHAWLMGGHTAMVLVAGFGGGVMVESLVVPHAASSSSKTGIEHQIREAK